MSKSIGQIVGGIVGAYFGGMYLGNSMLGGMIQGALFGTSIGGIIDPPPGPNLRGPTLDDTSFNSSAYGVALPRLFGTIATTGNIFYLENNQYKAVAKKQKTGGKGGGSQGSYTTTTYYATFCVAVGEVMPGSKIRRIWAGGKLIYSVGDGVNAGTLIQSKKNQGKHPSFSLTTGEPAADAEKWHYYDGTQTEPDSRMEAVLGVDNCPSYEGTAYIIFYDFDLTEYGNGLQGCPIKVELVTVEEVFDSSKFSKIYEAILPYPANRYDSHWLVWRQNIANVRLLAPGSATFVAQWYPYDNGFATATIYSHDVLTGNWITTESGEYDTNIHRFPGLTFGAYKNWQEFDVASGTLPNAFADGAPVGWNFQGGNKLTFGGRLFAGASIFDAEPSLGAAYGNGFYFVINNSHILKLNDDGIVASRNTEDPPGATYIRLWFDEDFLYRAQPLSNGALKVWMYSADTLDLIRTFAFGSFPSSDSDSMLQFAVYGDLFIVGWATRYGAAGGELHYEQWRFKDFTVAQSLRLDTVVGELMSTVGVDSANRDLTALASDVVDGYRITDASSARACISPLQAAYLFDLIDVGYKIKAIKRGGTPTITIPYSDLGARVSSDSLGVVVKRDRETDTQLPSRYTVNYIDYNREYGSNSQYQDYPSRGNNERKIDVPVVLSADKAAQLADVLVNLSWTERDTYEFVLPQKYIGLIPSSVINVEVAPGLFVVLRVSNINYTVDQRLEVSARRAEPAVYQSSAVGISVNPPSENISLTVTPNLVLMDLPAINTETATPGFGAAMAANPNWKGGALLRSMDTGQTYDAIQSFGGNGTFGKAINALPGGDYFVLDYSSALTVNLLAGELFAITQEQLLAGKNYCAYGVDGRWEIIQFQNVTVNSAASVTISGLLRGLFGTEWAGELHSAGDWLVLLDDADNAFIGSDISAVGASRKYKGVSSGEDAQLVSAVDFIYRGVNLKPLSPVNVRGYIDSEVWYINVDQRTRLPSGQWATGIAAPMGESSLSFEFEIYDGSVLKNTYKSSSPSLIYSSAQQMADFGYLPTTLTLKVYQISAAVGRGYAAHKVLVGVGDVYGDKVAFLLHFNGANDSAVFNDSSKRGVTVSPSGEAKISTAQFVFGGTSGLFDGVGDVIVVSHEAIGTNDFTLEGWIRPNSVSSSFVFYDSRDSALTNTGFMFYVNGVAGKLGFGTGATYVDTLGTTSLSANTWYHIRLVRLDGLVKGYLNGALEFTVSNSANFSNTTARMGHQFNVAGALSAGYIDDSRLTVGVARNTANFTPPSSQLPDPI